MNPVLVITERDNVATALEPLTAGQIVTAGGAKLLVVDAVPRGHKIALRDIAAGDAVLKYGSAIGVALLPIAAGTHVHTHNLASVRGRGDLAAQRATAEARIAEPDLEEHDSPEPEPRSR
jgi:altronate dehydratase